MRKQASTWIEGNGTVRTVFRTIALWAYLSEERAKLQLVKVIERKGDAPGPFILQYSIDRRKREIQWLSLYLPLLTLSIPSLLLIAGGLSSQNPRNLYISLAVVLYLIFLFRTTWFGLYLDACRFLHDAGDALLKERLGTVWPRKPNPPHSPLLKQPKFHVCQRKLKANQRPRAKAPLRSFCWMHWSKKGPGDRISTTATFTRLLHIFPISLGANQKIS